MYKKIFKRLIDIILSLLGIIILSPIIIILAILVKSKLGSPIIFSQERPGKNEKIFKMYKFRTMTDERDDSGNLLPDSERLPKFGRALRGTSLDELPELWNILKGEMSIVGPRPLSPKYLEFYSKEERRRHEVCPGLTGLAQVNGRNSISWDDKLKLDIKYINEISFIGDFRIILKTIKKVIWKEDIGQGEEIPVSLHIERSKKNDDEKRFL